MNIGFHVNSNRDIGMECAYSAALSVIKYGAVPVFRVTDEALFDGDTSGFVFEDFNKAGIDVMISIGGDGTFLAMISQWRHLDCDFVGINKGSIGFLTQIDTADVDDRIRDIISGSYNIIKRSQLLVEVYSKDNELRGREICFNDCSISRGEKLHITKLLLKIDGQVVERYYGDGLVISTATGSTAYSLAAGGPLLMPDMRDIIITSVCSHTLHNISYVIGENNKVEVIIEDFETAPVICPDGRDFIKPEPEDRVVISLYEKTVNTINFGQNRFFSDIRHKIIQRGSFYENG